MTAKIPPLDPPNLDKEKSQTEEKQYVDAEAAKDSSYKYGEHYKVRADEIKNKKFFWGGILFILLCTALLSPYISNYFLEKTIEVLVKAIYDLGYEVNLTSGQVIAIYYFLRVSFLVVMGVMITWVAHIFNQLRRLEITYRDKYIMAETYEKFIQNSNDEKSHELVRKHALEAMFSLTLEQAERD